MDLLTYYAEPTQITRIDPAFDRVLPATSDIAAVVAWVQGLLIHESLAPSYGVALAEDRLSEKQLHGATAMLERATRLDTSSLAESRSPNARAVGVCRHFATLFAAILRARRIPARVRCGFAAYFVPGKCVDHWVGEYWHAAEQRWVLVDAQVDALQRKLFGIAFDTLDVPRDQFLVAGNAWAACRNGADPQTFGVGGTELWGLVEVFGDVFQDLAALQKIELLPWGWYGLAATDESAAFRETDFIDRLAAISSAADERAITELQQLASTDERLRIPPERLQEIAAADLASYSTT